MGTYVGVPLPWAAAMIGWLVVRDRSRPRFFEKILDLVQGMPATLCGRL